ncbi:hypothetical protein NW752_009067 [Fusarium irregulare]|uniref:Uncharacterized protein n=1 Tax=Fusarium irregulare TaxID=2494466 RepID=A0A9W8PK60_9HYPO|nr:hypothetical protein NW766_008593 [Fusarium irregulare]KAJ4009893.1 hypothetical protein NW752_009067 [Fusarium irregulare]
MVSFTLFTLSALAAVANADFRIRCADASLPAGPGGTGSIPYKILTIGDDSCDYFKGTAGPCGDGSGRKSGPLKGKSLCNGAYWWKTSNGCQNVQLADGSHHYCCGSNDCVAG